MEPGAGPPGEVQELAERLQQGDYLADEQIAMVTFLALRLGKPLLIEGPAGVGKTELAKTLSTVLGMPLIRLQCYEGVDETKVLYEWNYRKQLLRIQAEGQSSWEDISHNIFSEPFLLERPVLKALRSSEPSVLLIDEIDKLDMEAEALLLEVLSDWQITIPEMGSVKATHQPIVVLTSNDSRELSEALKRRCLYLYMDYPDQEREKAIILRRVPEISETLADQVVKVVHTIRGLEMRKEPSIAETLDWARTLLHLNVGTLDTETLQSTLSVLLKFHSDLEKARQHLRLED
ncbi:MAG: AAA family ATPase [Actinomycetota bacterium]